MLAIARSLLMAPSLLLVDEPSMGLAPLLVRRIFGVMRDVFARHDVSVLLIEQDTAVALDLATWAYLLEQGRIVAEAPAAELRQDPRLKRSYIGAVTPTEEES
jgi:branched-chain amino acid transport system ATP-binding protein